MKSYLASWEAALSGFTHRPTATTSYKRWTDSWKRIDRESDAVVRNGKTTLVRPYPISIAWPNPWVEQGATSERCRASVRRNSAFLLTR